MSAPVWAQLPLSRARCCAAGPGTGSSVPSPVVVRTTPWKRRAVGRDGRACISAGSRSSACGRDGSSSPGCTDCGKKKSRARPVGPLMHEVSCGLGRLDGAGARVTRARKPSARRGKGQGVGFRLLRRKRRRMPPHPFRTAVPARVRGRLRALAAAQPLGHTGAGVGLRGRHIHRPRALVGRPRRSRSHAARRDRGATVITSVPVQPVSRAETSSMTISWTSCARPSSSVHRS